MSYHVYGTCLKTNFRVCDFSGTITARLRTRRKTRRVDSCTVTNLQRAVWRKGSASRVHIFGQLIRFESKFTNN
jgi:hypothetical protein